MRWQCIYSMADKVMKCSGFRNRKLSICSDSPLRSCRFPPEFRFFLLVEVVIRILAAEGQRVIVRE